MGIMILPVEVYRDQLMLQIVRKDLVRDLVRDILSSGLLELLATSVGNLLVGRAHLRGVDLTAAVLGLDRIKTLVNVVLLTSTGVVVRAGALAAHLVRETRKLVHCE
jgi:hypothetical protein